MSTASGAMTLAQHLRELRNRIVKSALAILVGTILVWQQFARIFSVIREPFDHVANDSTVLALTGVTSGFSMQLRVSLATGVVLTAPIWLYQIWRFIAPGLRGNEKKWAYIFAGIATPLFLSGVALAYAVMPRMLKVLFEFTPSDVSNFTSVDAYLSFFLQLAMFFGIGFLLPLVLVGLNFSGILTGSKIASAWRWIILGSFVFGAVATPNGDPIGMTIV
ncbi:MAG: Sec-independent protein translocase protein TatC, partial [Actinomycetota bacterium]